MPAQRSQRQQQAAVVGGQQQAAARGGGGAEGTRSTTAWAAAAAAVALGASSTIVKSRGRRKRGRDRSKQQDRVAIATHRRNRVLHALSVYASTMLPRKEPIAAPRAGDFCIPHVMGVHAGCNNAEIFDRKIRDVRNLGYCIWVTTLSGQRKDSIIGLLRQRQAVDVYFVSSSPKGGRGLDAAVLGDKGTKDVEAKATNGETVFHPTRFQSVVGWPELQQSGAYTSRAEFTALPDKMNTVNGGAFREDQKMAFVLTELVYNPHNTTCIDLRLMKALDGWNTEKYGPVPERGVGPCFNAGNACKVAVQCTDEAVVVRHPAVGTNALALSREIWARGRLVDVVRTA
jgi:hypothetical protein